MSPRPEKTLAMVFCRPKDSAMDPTPSAATKAVGWMPNTGSSTANKARNHTSARAMLTKIEPLGTLATVSTRSMALVATRWMMAATTKTTTKKTAFITS